LFSVLVEDSGLASTILFSVIGFLGEVSLALSTDIIFPYRHLEPQDASDIAPVTPLRACAFAAIAGKDNGGSFRISQT
jgi:hypothetical protein